MTDNTTIHFNQMLAAMPYTECIDCVSDTRISVNQFTDDYEGKTFFLYRHCRQDYTGLLLLSLSLFMLGCVPGASPGTAVEPSEKITLSTKDTQEATRWNLGISSPGGSTVVTMPLEDERVCSLTDITSVTTSCDCVSALPVSYIDVNGQRSFGICMSVESTQDEIVTSHGRTLYIEIRIAVRTGSIITRQARVILAGKDRDE
ncbi:hypothetical protein C5Y93_13645 [Blastopirellula marina]|uniref:Uncharacterized protein n=1 Tax=Blastopirellula marina TaxID=124 RepID=A0A2S8GM37_9BACT|nr:hypothetical protein C5Y93_13645 [Blastopirellula marina]